MTKNRVLMIAGGTGGHIFPALAVANRLREQGADVHWLGSKIGLEGELVSPHFPIEFIDISAVRRNGLLAKLLMPVQLLRAVLQSIQIIRKLKPQVVVGMGGFAAGPGGLAARVLGIPLIIHEQNSIPGLTNKILAKFAKKVLTGFPDVFPAHVNAQMIGNPVRESFAHIAEPTQRYASHEGAMRVLIVGGSQGALSLNRILAKAFAQFPELESLSIYHQAGKLSFKELQAIYTDFPIKVQLVEFIDDIAKAYEWSDLVMCRAGALTVAEVAAVGVASVMVPFPQAVDNHQFFNAKYLADQQAAIVIPQQEFDQARVHDLLHQFLTQRDKLVEMAGRARQLAHFDAVNRVVEHINDYLN